MTPRSLFARASCGPWASRCYTRSVPHYTTALVPACVALTLNYAQPGRVEGGQGKFAARALAQMLVAVASSTATGVVQDGGAGARAGDAVSDPGGKRRRDMNVGDGDTQRDAELEAAPRKRSRATGDAR